MYKINGFYFCSHFEENISTSLPPLFFSSLCSVLEEVVECCNNPLRGFCRTILNISHQN